MNQPNRVGLVGLLVLATIFQLHAIETPECIRAAMTWANNHRHVTGVALGSVLGFATAKIGGFDVRRGMKLGLFLGWVSPLIRTKEHVALIAASSVLAGGTAAIFRSPHWPKAVFIGASCGFIAYLLFILGRYELISCQKTTILRNDPDFIRISQEYDAHIRRSEPYHDIARKEGSTLGQGWWIQYEVDVQRMNRPGFVRCWDRCRDESGKIFSFGAGHREGAQEAQGENIHVPGHHNPGPVIEEVASDEGQQPVHPTHIEES